MRLSKKFGDLKVAMLGLGSMNTAILKGLFTAGVSREHVIATTNSAESAQAKSDALGIQVLSAAEQADANTVAVDGADIVFVGVLPPKIGAVCAEVANALTDDAIVVSVAAGVTLSTLEGALRPGQRAVRTMPNTPLQIGSGSVGLTPGAAVTDEDVDMLRELFAPGGRVHVVAESQMDEFNAMAGSAPGYLYYLAQHMTAAGIELGFDPEVSARLTADTMLGAAKILVNEFAEQGPSAAQELREEMVLPGGTTRAAFVVFDEQGMAAAIREGIAASAARSAEITREIAEADA